MIKVLLVDDSSFMRRVVKELLAEAGDLIVCGEAVDGKEALIKVQELKPDVVCLDMVMPTQDGLTTLRKIKELCPTPVVVFSTDFSPNAEIAGEMFRYGVIDAVQKPGSAEKIGQIKQELIEKLRIAGRIDKNKLISIYSRQEKDLVRERVYTAHSVIAIGSSAGGPPALESLLSCLPYNLPAGIIVAQHIPEIFLESFRYHLQKVISFPVKIAEDGDMVSFGRILISPVKKTLALSRLNTGGVVNLVESASKPKPSINVMFESVADVYRSRTIGIILSGMGEDGIKGLQAIKKLGGKVFSQNEKSALVWGMPKVALESGTVEKGSSIEEIAEEIVRILNGGRQK